jgi:cyanophycinase
VAQERSHEIPAGLVALPSVLPAPAASRPAPEVVNSVGSGPIALAGSGEFLPVMEPVDRALLRGRPPRAAILPTAAALEGDDRVAYWLDLGRRHYEAMDVEPVPVPVRNRADADDLALAALVAEVGLVYLSGGDPHYLASTLRGSAVWAAIVEAWQGGTALAGCSAGAMALGAGAPSLRGQGDVPAGVANGLGLLPDLAVIPHFDMIERWSSGAVDRFLAWSPAGTVTLGIEEETALVSAGSAWRVSGAGAVWVLQPGRRTRVAVGEEVVLPASSRALAERAGP